MKASGVSSDIPRPDPAASAVELELPDDPAPRWAPPLVSMEVMRRRIRQLREWFPAGIPSLEERWRAKTEEEFRL